MGDERLAQQVDEYAKIAKENPNVDMGLLMMNALQTQKANSVSGKAKRWAYLTSISAPPLGLFFALKYYFSDEDDAKEVAMICVILTVVALLMFWLFGKILFAGSGVSPQQIEQIKPADIYQLTQ